MLKELEEHMFKLCDELANSQLKGLLVKAATYIEKLLQSEKELKAIQRVEQ